MPAMRVLLLILTPTLIASPGCKPAPKPAPAEAPARIDPVAPKATPAPPSPPFSEKRRKREILVGGCNDACEAPRAALDGFLTACATADPEQVRPYLNTAVLVHDGTRHGAAWAALFMERKLGERKESIDNWLNGWLGWVDRLTDPEDRRRVTEGVEVLEENQSRFVVRWTHPDIATAPNSEPTGPIWRIALRKRGLEWLVAEISERP